MPQMGRSLSRRVLLRNAVWITTAAAALPILELTEAPFAAASTAGDAPSRPTFFVAKTGSDDADGLTPETAWATIQKVNAALPDKGSTVLFRRGDTFYGELKLPFGCEVGAYGAGERPVLTMEKLLNRPDGWVKDTDNVWKIDLGAPNTHDGYTWSNDANIGYLVVDGTVKPALKLDYSELSEPWDFYCDIPGHTLFVAAPANPTTLAADIKAAPNGNAGGATGCVISCMAGSNNIHDVHITGTGGCGIHGSAEDVNIKDCTVDYIGGSLLQDGTNRRYGNGIQSWVGAKRWNVENNEIAQVYDVAWSAQGDAGSASGWEDITVRGNYIHDCSQSFEFWSKGSESASGFQRILIEGNNCERAGYSAFSDVRPDQNVRVHLLTYVWDTPADITIRNNVFDNAYVAYSYHSHEPVGYATYDNSIRLKAGQKIEFQRPETVEDYVDWQAETGREAGSVFEIV
ncbi:right-handed parallel beta-helix repeat-containing protein [Mycolicibacterium sp. CBM1]